MAEVRAKQVQRQQPDVRKKVERQPEKRTAEREDPGLVRSELAGFVEEVEIAIEHDRVELREVLPAISAGAFEGAVKNDEQREEERDPHETRTIERAPHPVDESRPQAFCLSRHPTEHRHERDHGSERRRQPVGRGPREFQEKSVETERRQCDENRVNDDPRRKV